MMVWDGIGRRRRRAAIGAILVLAWAAAGPAEAQDPAPGTTILMPDETGTPAPDGSRLVLPGQPDRADPAAVPPTLPPLWLVPLPDQGAQAAERARLDAALAARFAHPAPPPQRFDADIVPLAGGQPWQAMQRRIDGTLGP